MLWLMQEFGQPSWRAADPESCQETSKVIAVDLNKLDELDGYIQVSRGPIQCVHLGVHYFISGEGGLQNN